MIMYIFVYLLSVATAYGCLKYLKKEKEEKTLIATAFITGWIVMPFAIAITFGGWIARMNKELQ